MANPAVSNAPNITTCHSVICVIVNASECGEDPLRRSGPGRDRTEDVVYQRSHSVVSLTVMPFSAAADNRPGASDVDTKPVRPAIN